MHASAALPADTTALAAVVVTVMVFTGPLHEEKKKVCSNGGMPNSFGISSLYWSTGRQAS